MTEMSDREQTDGPCETPQMILSRPKKLYDPDQKQTNKQTKKIKNQNKPNQSNNTTMSSFLLLFMIYLISVQGNMEFLRILGQAVPQHIILLPQVKTKIKRPKSWEKKET